MVELYCEHIETAIRIAATFHLGQLDKGGQPYIFHPLSVMFRVRKAGGSIEEQIVAVMHDLPEDTDYTVKEMAISWPPVVVEAVDALTRRKRETYGDYIVRVKANPIARKVKLKDLEDNLDPDRQGWAKNDEQRANLYQMNARYVAARTALLEGAQECKTK